jgi:hypothetical protein
MDGKQRVKIPRSKWAIIQEMKLIILFSQTVGTIGT